MFFFCFIQAQAVDARLAYLVIEYAGTHSSKIVCLDQGFPNSISKSPPFQKLKKKSPLPP